MVLRFSRSRVGIVLAGILIVSMSAPAFAAPEPTAGPTVGGTVVSDKLPDTVFTDIAAGYLYSLALDSKGAAYGWGYNYFGTLGNGGRDNPAKPNSRPRPAIMPDGVEFSAISAGFDHAAALTEQGDVFTWGTNTFGQLGTGTEESSDIPERVTMPVPMREIAASWRRTWAIGMDGNLYGWGMNTDSSLGDGTDVHRLAPVQLPAPNGVTFSGLSALDEHAIAIGSDGQTYSWGRNDGTQLGNGNTTVGTTPQPLPKTHEPYTAVGTGKLQSIGIAADGRAYAWGDNWYGQLGNGTSENLVRVPTQVASPEGVRFRSVAGGLEFSAGIAESGALYAWGRNNLGQLGDGTTVGRSIPALVVFPEPVVVEKVSLSSQRHALALTAEGEIYAWGANEAGGIGDGTTQDALLPVKLAGSSEVTEVLFGTEPGVALSQQGNTWTATTPGGCGPVDVTVRFSQLGVEREQVYPEGFVYGTAPVIVEHPVSAELSAGDTFTTRVETTGDPEPTVTWQVSLDGETGWEDLPGMGTVFETEVERASSYRAVATSCAGTAISDAATLLVITEPGTGGGNGGGSTGGGGGTGGGPGGGGGTGGGGTGGGGAVPPKATSVHDLPPTGDPIMLSLLVATAAALLGSAGVLLIGRRVTA